MAGVQGSGSLPSLSLQKQNVPAFTCPKIYVQSRRLKGLLMKINPKVPSDLRKKASLTVLLVLCAGAEKSTSTSLALYTSRHPVYFSVKLFLAVSGRYLEVKNIRTSRNKEGVRWKILE